MSATDTDTLGNMLAKVAVIDPDLPAEQVVRNFQLWEAFEHRVKEIGAAARAQMVEYVTVNGPLDAGNVFYWAGHDKRTKCNDVAAAVEALLMESNGDIATFCRDYLSSGAVKYGAAKRTLDAATYARLFTTEVVDKLESGEQLPKKLIKADKQFIK